LNVLVDGVIREHPGRGVELTRGSLKALGVNVSRERVREMFRKIDPEGNELRKRKCLRRRVYHSQGIHHVWHMDGWHKLIKYGFVVHAAIDGRSRYIVFMHCSDNNESLTVLEQFRIGAEEIKIIPKAVRTDKGGENVDVWRFMLLFWGVDSNCYKAASSNLNQRVERGWRDMRNSTLQTYIDTFLLFEMLGMDVDNAVHMFCLHFMFKDRINTSISSYRNAWNHHPMSSENNRSPVNILFTENDSNGGSVYNENVVNDIVSTIRGANVLDVPRVNCMPKKCPLNDDKWQLFVQTITPFTIFDDLESLWPRFLEVIRYTEDLLRA